MMGVVNKLILAFSVLSVIILAMPMTAYAQFDPTTEACAQGSAKVCNGGGSANPLTGSGGILNKVARLMIVIIGVAAVIMIMIGGLMMILANGDAQRFATGRNTLIYAFVGLGIAVIAQGIIGFVLPRLTG